MGKPRLGEEKAALREKRGRSRRAETFSHETLTLRSRPLLFCDPHFLVSITLNATTVSVSGEAWALRARLPRPPGLWVITLSRQSGRQPINCS